MNDDTTWDEADRELLESLARVALLVDPEPPYLRELGRAALSIRWVDAELAELIADSQLAAGAVRSVAATTMRILAFAHGRLSLDVQAELGDAGWDLLGVAEGVEPSATQVDVETAGGVVLMAQLDVLGRFAFVGVPAGLIRLRVVGAGGVDVTTEWVRLAAEG